MLQHVSKAGDVEVRILLHARPDDNAAESDEEVDGRLRFEIADAVADECGLAVRASADVAHDEFLAARTSEKRAAIEILVVAVRIEPERHGVDVSNVQRLGERTDSLFDSGGDEMDNDAVVLQR